VVRGAPGSGKTILGNQICFENARRGGSSAYVTLLAESHARMMLHLESVDFFDLELAGDSVRYLSAYGALMKSGLPGVLDFIRAKLPPKRGRAARGGQQEAGNFIVIDGFLVLSDASSSTSELKKFIQDLQLYADLVGATVLLLAGVTLNSFFSALIMFVQYIADFVQVYRAMRWIMGDLDVGSFEPIIAALPMLAIAFAMFAWLPSSLNLLSVGADAASARGVDVGRTQRLAFVSASLATAAAVSLAGPIGFIGIVVPHLVRLMVGVDHRLVLPASALFGGAFLVLCDLGARTLLAPLEIPVGVITAMLGGPFFLWLLVRKG